MPKRAGVKANERFVDSYEAMQQQLLKRKLSANDINRHTNAVGNGLARQRKNPIHANAKEEVAEYEGRDAVDDVSTPVGGATMSGDARNALQRASILRRRGQARQESTERPSRCNDVDKCHEERTTLQRGTVPGRRLKKIVFNGTFPIDDPYSSRFGRDGNTSE